MWNTAWSTSRPAGLRNRVGGDALTAWIAYVSPMLKAMFRLEIA
jgi:hypothetical protein